MELLKTKILLPIAAVTAANKPLKRAFEFYFKLKTINTSGHWQSSNYVAAAKQLQITIPTFYSRLKLCKQFGLTVHSKKSFTLISYEKALEKYAPGAQQKFYYSVQPDVQLVLDALAIRLRKKAMQQAFYKKINKYQIAETLSLISGRNTGSPDFMKAVLISQIMDHVKNDTNNAMYELNQVNADDNMNYATLSTLFGYAGYGSLAYKKRKMSAKGLAQIAHRQFSVNPHRYSSILGNICYFRPQKLRKLTLPDSINLL